MNSSVVEHLDIERTLAMLRRRWWVVVLFTVLVGAGAFAFSELQTKQYTGTASVLFENSQVNQQASGLQVIDTSPSQDPVIMATNVQLLRSHAGVASATARDVGHGLTASEVSDAISVSQQAQTNVATVSATDPSPAIAAAIANHYVREFISAQQVEQQAQVEQALKLVQRQIAALSPRDLGGPTGQSLVDRAESLRILTRLQDGGAQFVAPAKEPRTPSSPKVLRNTVLGLLLGLLLGLTIATLLERLDRRVKNVDELEAAYELPLLAAISSNKRYAVPPQLAPKDHRADTDVFKLLRTYLRYFNVDRELTSLLIVSEAPGDGKSTVSRNLAQAAQETGTKTLLLEADLRRPSVARFYGLKASQGISGVLIGSVSVDEAVDRVPVASRVNGAGPQAFLDVLVAGAPPPNPVELIESQAMANLLVWAAETYELVVIDTPPLSVVPDAVPLVGKVDGVVVVSRVGKSTRDAASLLRARLVAVDAPVLGVIANGVHQQGRNGSGYEYGYYVPDIASDESTQLGSR